MRTLFIAAIGLIVMAVFFFIYVLAALWAKATGKLGPCESDEDED